MSREANIANLRWLVTVSADGALKSMAGIDAAMKQVGKSAHDNFEKLDDPLRHFEVILNRLMTSMNKGNFTAKIGKDLDDLIDKLRDPKLQNLKLFDSFGNNRLESLQVISKTLGEKYVVKNPTEIFSDLGEDAAAFALRQQSELTARLQAQAAHNQNRSKYGTQVANQFYDPGVQAEAMQRAREDRDNTTRGETLIRRAINHARRYFQEEADYENGTNNSERFRQGESLRLRADLHAANDAQRTATTVQDYADRARYGTAANRPVPPEPPSWTTANANTQRILNAARGSDDSPFVRKLASMSREEVEKVRQRFQQMADAGGNYSKQLEGLATDTRNRAQDDRMGRGSNTRQFRWQMMNLGYGIEDASVGYQLNGLKGAIRGSLNNITAMAQGIRNPYMAGGAVIAATAAGMTLPPLMDYMTRLSKGRTEVISAQTNSNYDEFDTKEADLIAKQHSAQFGINETNRSMLRGANKGNYGSVHSSQEKNADSLEQAELKAATAKRMRDQAKQNMARIKADPAGEFGMTNPLYGNAEEGNEGWQVHAGEAIRNFFSNSRASARAAYNTAKLQAEQADREWGEASDQAIEAKRRATKLESAQRMLAPTRDLGRKLARQMNEIEEFSSDPVRDAELAMENSIEEYGARVRRSNEGTKAEREKRIAEHRREARKEFEDEIAPEMEMRKEARDKAKALSDSQMRQHLREGVDPTASVNERHYQQGMVIARMGLKGSEEKKLHEQNDYARQMALDRINNLDYKPVNHSTASGSVQDAAMMQQFGANLNTGGGDQVGIALVAVQQDARSLLQELVDAQRRRNLRNFRRG